MSIQDCWPRIVTIVVALACMPLIACEDGGGLGARSSPTVEPLLTATVTTEAFLSVRALRSSEVTDFVLAEVNYEEGESREYLASYSANFFNSENMLLASTMTLFSSEALASGYKDELASTEGATTRPYAPIDGYERLSRFPETASFVLSFVFQDGPVVGFLALAADGSEDGARSIVAPLAEQLYRRVGDTPALGEELYPVDRGELSQVAMSIGSHIAEASRSLRTTVTSRGSVFNDLRFDCEPLRDADGLAGC